MLIFENSHLHLEFFLSDTYNFAQRMKMLLVNKNENIDPVFCICIEYDSKARKET